MPSDDLANLYALAAEFDSAEALTEAARRVHEAGYRRVEAYTPHAVSGLADTLGFGHTGVPLLVFLGGLLGAIGGYFMLWYANVISYPWNTGGKPPNSWPAFIPITFEMMVLGAATMAVVALIVLCGLPQPYHPVFNAPGFERASQDRFFLCIEAADPRFDAAVVRRLLEEFSPLNISEVPWR